MVQACDTPRDEHCVMISTLLAGKARKLRQLTVEKGLLREVKQTQRMVDALVQCKASGEKRCPAYL